MHEPRGGQRLAAEARHELGVVGEVLGQQLHGDAALEPAVARQADGRHAADAEAGAELVAAGDQLFGVGHGDAHAAARRRRLTSSSGRGRRRVGLDRHGVGVLVVSASWPSSASCRSASSSCRCRVVVVVVGPRPRSRSGRGRCRRRVPLREAQRRRAIDARRQRPERGDERLDGACRRRRSGRASTALATSWRWLSSSSALLVRDQARGRAAARDEHCRGAAEQRARRGGGSAFARSLTVLKAVGQRVRKPCSADRRGSAADVVFRAVPDRAASRRCRAAATRRVSRRRAAGRRCPG